MTSQTFPPTTAETRRVAIVEDHVLQRRRTEELVRTLTGVRIVHSCETLPELLDWLTTADTRQRPHLVLLDLVVERGPDADAESVRRLAESGIRVLVLSAMASPVLVRDVVRVGIAGIVGKRDSESDVVAAIRAALSGRRWVTPELAAVMAGDSDRPALSDQEERALVLYASGLTLDEVATALGVRRGTAKKYLERVKLKYEAAGRPVRTKLDMAREGAHDGLL